MASTTSGSDLRALEEGYKISFIQILSLLTEGYDAEEYWIDLLIENSLMSMKDTNLLSMLQSEGKSIKLI